MNQSPIIIAISAISGGGKSTIVNQLAAKLQGSATIHFDDYATATTYPSDFDAWAKTGFDLNVLQAPLLAEHLTALKAGETVVSPNNGKVIDPAKVILFEAPLGRADKTTAPLIDYMIFIDTPLELGLARMIARAINPTDIDQLSAKQLADQIHHVDNILTSYIDMTRHAYKAQREQVLPDCDLVVDGSGTVAVTTNTIFDALIAARIIE